MVPHHRDLGKQRWVSNYVMSGRAFNTVHYCGQQRKIMGPKQIAGVMSLVRRDVLLKGLEFDEDEDRKITVCRALPRTKILALYASKVTDDGIIDPRDTRDVIAMSLSLW